MRGAKVTIDHQGEPSAVGLFITVPASDRALLATALASPQLAPAEKHTVERALALPSDPDDIEGLEAWRARGLDESD